MGCAPVLFVNAGEFLSALAAGCRFDLLVLMRGTESKLDGLLSVCGVLGLPILQVVQDPQWNNHLLSLNDGFVWDRMMSLPVSRTSGEELDRCMRMLLGRRDVSQRVVPPEVMAWGDYRFADDGSQTVQHRSRNVRLQPRQFAFALALFRNMGCVLTRDELRTSVWKHSPNAQAARTIDVCAAGLRRKLELRSENGFVLRGVYGRGYLLIAARPFVPEAMPNSPSFNGLAAEAAQTNRPARFA